MTKTTYIPRPDGMPGLLMQHLRKHPSATFTGAAIALKFGGKASGVQTALTSAVAAGLLARTPNGGPRGQFQYSAGPQLASADLMPKPKPNVAPLTAPPAAGPDALCGYGTYCQAADTVSLNAQQREQLCLVIGAFVLSAPKVLEAAQ